MGFEVWGEGFRGKTLWPVALVLRKGSSMSITVSTGTWFDRVMLPGLDFFKVEVSLFMVYGLGFRVWGLGFRVQGLGFRVQRLGFRVQGSGCMV